MPIISILSLAALLVFGIALFVAVKEERERKTLEAQRKNKEDYTHVLIHELRAPLTAIKDSAEFMLSDGSLETNKEQQFLKIIETQSKMLLEQVGSLLDGAKIQAGKFILNKTASDISQTIKDRILIFQAQAEKEQIHLVFEEKEKIPPFSFDPLRVAQVINNLLSNSLKFTKSGGTITVKAVKDLDCIKISVSDTGVGIPKEQQQNLFEKFSKIGEDKQSSQDSSGLGLYIVKGIAQAHGGTVGLESNPGDGTTIFFTLPIT